MRYHVISLVAVFLALGIGILLGTTLVERGLIAEQKGQISSLQKTFDEIKEKNSALHEELDVYRDYATQSEQYVIADRLAGIQYATMAKKDPDEDVLGKISETVKNAGGNVPITITMSAMETFEEPVVVSALAGLFGLPPDPAVLRDRVVAEVVEQLKNATNVQMLADLERAGVLQVRGTLTGPLAGLILTGPIDAENLDSIDIPVINAAIASQFPIVGAGGPGTEETVMESYKNTGISTVEHVETVPGRVALVLVLSGNSGNYGLGKSSSRLLPEARGF